MVDLKQIDVNPVIAFLEVNKYLHKFEMHKKYWN